MTTMNKHINLIKIAIVLFVPYIFQFILLPLILPDVKGNGIYNAATIFTIIFSILGMVFLTDKLHHWLLSDLAWILLALLYHPPGIYGIGMSMRIGFPIMDAEPYIPHYDRTFAWFGIIFNVIGSFLIQFAVWLCIKLFKAVKAHLKKKKAEA